MVSQLFSVGEAVFFARKPGFRSYNSHKIAEVIVSYLGRVGFGCSGGYEDVMLL